MKKILIAYYSRSGENYVSGNIRYLQTGNTEYVASRIASLIQADIFKIEPVKIYPSAYTEMTRVAMVELQNKERPALSGCVKNMDEYDTIILGYPNWWGTMPMCVFTFLESYDLSGKALLPFCTHEGSGLGHSVEDLYKVNRTSKIKNGLAIRGSHINDIDRSIKIWLKENSVIIK